MKKTVLTVTLNPAVDVITFVDGFSSKGINRGGRQVISTGGKGINVSRVLTRLGVPTLALGIGGGATGNLIAELLDAEGIPHDLTRAEGAVRINVTVLDMKKEPAGRIRVLGPGATLNRSEIDAFEKKYKEKLAQSRVVVFSGRNIPGASEDLYARLIHSAREARVPAVLDTSGGSLRRGLKAGPFMVKPNLPEAREALGCRLDTMTQKKKAIQEFHRLGSDVVLLSMGAKGALASDGTDIWRATPPAVEARSNVGCGDAMVGGFLDAHLRRMSFACALRWAVAAGAANAMAAIPGLIRRKDLLQLSQTVSIRKI